MKIEDIEMLEVGSKIEFTWKEGVVDCAEVVDILGFGCVLVKEESGTESKQKISSLMQDEWGMTCNSKL